MWFGTASDIVRVIAVGVAAYASVVVVLRVSGKRTLSKLNAFDLVVTVALGSILATAALPDDVTLADAVVAFTILIAAQFVVAWLSVRSSAVRSVVRSQPARLVENGRIIDDELRRNRVAASEVRQAVRSAGHGGLDAIAAVVLETDGSLSVISHDAYGSGDALDEID